VEFYRYNGSLLVILLPLLILPVIQYSKYKSEIILYKFMVCSIFVNFLGVIYQLYLSYKDITGLFISTNGFGGFMITPLLISYFILLKNSSMKYKIFFIMALFLMLISYSRGSIIFSLISIICYHAFRKKINLFCFLIFIIICTQVYILVDSYQIYIINQDHIMSYINDSSESIKHGNILLRVYENWPRGLFHFFNSPIIGTGFGSINDQSGINGYGIFNISSAIDPIYNSAHAHHQYLNVLGEQGLLGFIIFILLLHSIYKYLILNFDESLISSVLLTSFYALTLVSFTENRISSPSNIFPFILIFIIFYIKNLNVKKN
jgi:hypothetical protein